jgi:AmmeMemoRadiSam system protein B/AmmeMemoRadiSam system protein A
MKWKKSGCFLAVFLLFFLLFLDRGKGVCEMSRDIRKAELAGTWYPGNPERLKADILRFLGQVPREKVEGKLVALVSPHAGIVYSGQVAAFGYKLIEGETFDSVIVIGPSHRSRFRGVSVYDRGGFETPLGVVPVDTQLAEELIARDKAISFRPEAFLQENSIEIQIPFLQTVLGRFKFVPIAMGTQDEATCRMLADAIMQSVGDRKVLIVASSDLSHYHRYERAVAMDTELIDKVARMDVRAFLEALESGEGEACGGGAVAVAMMVGTGMGPAKARILKYANSGDVTGDRSGVVGYLSGAVYLPGGPEKEEGIPSRGVDLGLSGEEKKALLETARKSIEARLNGKDFPPPEIESERFREKRGAFVTLKKNARLRGCIGFIEGRKPLLRTIQEMAQAAAFEDPRFYPVTKEELDGLDIEISVLTPLRRVQDVNEIEVGKHGIYIVKGYRSGLLLPQVATEYGWDRTTFLNETCRKAGLKPGDWKEKGTEIFIFSADIFGEKER